MSGNPADSIADPRLRYRLKALAETWPNGWFAVSFEIIVEAPRGNFGSALLTWKERLGLEGRPIRDPDTKKWVIAPEHSAKALTELRPAFNEWGIEIEVSHRDHKSAIDWPLWRLT